MGIKGFKFKELIDLFRNAGTVVVEGKPVKNKYGNVDDLIEEHIVGRKEYFEEVVEVKNKKIYVYSNEILKNLVMKENSNYIEMYKTGKLILYTKE